MKAGAKMEEYINDEELSTMMREMILDFSKISKCNERWMSAHKYNSSDSKIVLVLWDNPNGCTQNEICKVSGVSKQQVSAVLKKFEKKEYIVRTKDTNDERKNKIALTELGRDVCIKVNNDFCRFFKYIAEKLPEQERKDVLAAFSLVANLYSKALDERGY